MDRWARRQAGPTFHQLGFVLPHSRNDHTDSSYQPNLLDLVVRPAGALRQRLPRVHLSRLGRFQRLRSSLRPRGRLETPLRLPLRLVAPFARLPLRLRGSDRVFAGLGVRAARPSAQLADPRGEASLARPGSERGALGGLDGGRRAAGERGRGPASGAASRGARAFRSGEPSGAGTGGALELGAGSVELRVALRDV